jgi:hypothetical protein
MRHFWLITILALQIARAQVPTALTETMKSIQETLNGQGPVKWVQTQKTAGAEPVSITFEMSGATADANACSVSFATDSEYPNYKIKFVWKLPLRDVERITVYSVEAAAERFRAESKLPKWNTTTDPTVYNMQIYPVADKKFEVHRRSVNGGTEVIERDQQMAPAVIIFREEETAQRVSRAMLKARDLCSGR